MALGLQSPWQIYVDEVTALFKEDPDISINYDQENKILKIYVESEKKATALDRLLPCSKQFGNVTLYIEVIPANKVQEQDRGQLFADAFEGNPAFSRVVSGSKGLYNVTYVMFEPKVVQYFNDDLQDANGYCHTLYQNLAKDIFDTTNMVFFSTELQEGVNKPLGEWP